MHFQITTITTSILLTTLLTPFTTISATPTHLPSSSKKALPHPAYSVPAKYFHEPGTTLQLSHYDARFFHHPLPYSTHRDALSQLFHSYLTFTHEHEIETWLAHGSLLGWYWNQEVLPWDEDGDVQVSAGTLREVVERGWNGTIWSRESESEIREKEEEAIDMKPRTERIKTATETRAGRYLLDINPHSPALTNSHTHPRADKNTNTIDARWIDTLTGLYIDITAISPLGHTSSTANALDRSKALGFHAASDRHVYRTAEIWPLQHTTFEGVKAWVPAAVERVLGREYGGSAMERTEICGHVWDDEGRRWVRQEASLEEEEGDVETEL